MASKVTAVVLGVRDASRAFKKVEPAYQAHVGEATKDTADATITGAKRRVPVRYGTLRDFIVTKYSARTGIATVGVRRGTAVIDGRSVNPAVYGRFVHWGTAKNAARPFMLDAAEEQRGPYAQRTRTACDGAARELAAQATVPTEG